MTTQGGAPGPGSQPAGDPYRPPTAGGQQSPPPGWGPQPPPGAWPGPSRPTGDHDRTARTIGIIALVVGSIALLAQLTMVLFPLVLLGGLIGGIDDDWVAEGPGPVVVSGFSGSVPLGADGSVDGVALHRAVAANGMRSGALDRPATSFTCDAAARATHEDSVLCRGQDGEEWYAVVRFTDDSGSFVVTLLGDEAELW